MSFLTEVQTVRIGDFEEAAVNDRVMIMSTSSQHLNGKEGKIARISVGKSWVELFICLDAGVNTWIDSGEVILIG